MSLRRKVPRSRPCTTSRLGPTAIVLPVRLPSGFVRPVFAVAEWGHWRMLKPADDEQPRTLGPPQLRVPSDAAHRRGRSPR